MRLADPVEQLNGVGPHNAKKLQKLGIFSTQDLLFHIPRRYDDLSTITPIAQVRSGADYVIRARVESRQLRQSFHRRMKILEALVSDATGSLMLVWFNQPYLERIFQKGKIFLFAGAVTFYDVLQMQNPQWQDAGDRALHVGSIVPVYDLTQGIFPKWLRLLIKRTLDSVPPLADYLPPWLRASYNLPTLDQAIRAIHFPKNLIEAQTARRRFAFEELLFHCCSALLHKRTLHSLTATPLPFDEQSMRQFVAKLPFTLTPSQKKAGWVILQDLQQSRPANRLLSGDVGSGKTIVAALAALQAIRAGSRVVFMVPTEILAQQHFSTFTQLPEFTTYSIGLLCRSRRLVHRAGKTQSLSKKSFLKILEDNKLQMVIGTHALLQKVVPVRDLGLVIVDEQHRFGVQQRAFLQRQTGSGSFPHFLSLTATPIPRTLALSLYGDLDISRIKHLPSGRKKIITEIVPPHERPRMYKRILELLQAGQQAFVICPLIDPSDTLGVKSVTEECQRLQREVFPTLRLGLLHGKLSPDEKETVIRQFSERTLHLLVSTTVVEVGVDFPNATVMVVEGTERFGLAQLHQLRGRVGRNDLQSYCFLLPSSDLTEQATKRLQAVVDHSDGLELAEIDLQLRGPGQTYGLEQSGYPSFKISDLSDTELLEHAHAAASDLLASPDLARYPLLRKKMESLEKELHME